MILIDYDEANGGIYDYFHKLNAPYLHLDHDYSEREVDDMEKWIKNKGQIHV